LFFHEHFVEITHGFIQFFAQLFGPLGVTTAGKLSDAARLITVTAHTTAYPATYCAAFTAFASAAAFTARDFHAVHGPRTAGAARATRRSARGAP
jgi:hypothetical protein